MEISDITKVIPEKHIIVFSPHFDDSVLGLGGYMLELKKKNMLDTKDFRILINFSRSNYIAGSGDGNRDTSLDRVKYATGKRVMEDMGCIDEILGYLNYTYQLIGEKECFTRGKAMADSEMEFPHGMYDDFDEEDKEIFERSKSRIRKMAFLEDTALVFPIGYMEHIDHFILREAAITVAGESGSKARSAFYFMEDKPYAGISDEDEIARIDDFIKNNGLAGLVYESNPEALIKLVYKHYLSQVEDVYEKGIRQRSDFLRNLYKLDEPCERLFRLKF